MLTVKFFLLLSAVQFAVHCKQRALKLFILKIVGNVILKNYFVIIFSLLGKRVHFKDCNKILIILIPPLGFSNIGIDFKQNKINFFNNGEQLEGNSFSILSILSPINLIFSPK